MLNKLLQSVGIGSAQYRHAGNGLPFYQEFEFKPFNGEFRGRLDELEAAFSLTETGAVVTLQVDRAVRGLGSLLSESMGMDESYTSFAYTQADMPMLDQLLAKAIRPYC